MIEATPPPPIPEYTPQVSINEQVHYIDLNNNYDNAALLTRLLTQADVELMEVDIEQVESLRLLTDDNYAANVLITQVLEAYGNHGHMVTSATEEILRRVVVLLQKQTKMK